MARSAFPNDEMICEQHLADQTIEVGPKRPTGFLRCTLERCHVVLRDSHPAIHDSQLIDCTIECTRRMTERGLPRFTTSEYARCKFIGRFQGVDFGRWPYRYVVGYDNGQFVEGFDQLGGLIDCDFTESTLDLCRFFSVDITKQRFAPWPQFVIPGEKFAAAAQLEYAWPGEMARFIRLAKSEHAALTAGTGTLADFTKRYAVTARELEEALDFLGGVLR